MADDFPVTMLGPDNSEWTIPSAGVKDAIQQGMRFKTGTPSPGALPPDLAQSAYQTATVAPDQSPTMQKLTSAGATIANTAGNLYNKFFTSPGATFQQPTELQQAAAIQDPTQRGQAIQAALQRSAQPISQAAQAAVPIGVGEKAVQAGLEYLPKAVEAQRAAAGQAIGTVEQGLRGVPIDTTQPLATAVKAQELSAGGQTLPQVLGKFLDRLGLGQTPGVAGGAAAPPSPVTFEQGRAFAKTAGGLSAAEKFNSTAEMKSYINQFAGEISDSLKATAKAHGFEPQYSEALADYHQAKTIQDVTDVIKKWGVGTLLGALGSTGAGYAFTKGAQLAAAVTGAKKK